MARNVVLFGLIRCMKGRIQQVSTATVQKRGASGYGERRRQLDDTGMAAVRAPPLRAAWNLRCIRRRLAENSRGAAQFSVGQASPRQPTPNPCRSVITPGRVRAAEHLMRIGGYEVGAPMRRGARQWLRKRRIGDPEPGNALGQRFRAMISGRRGRRDIPPIPTASRLSAI